MKLEEVQAIRERAEGQAFAHSEMVAIGKGVGGLEVYRPDLYEDLEAWSRSTENDHADTTLALLDHVEALRTRIETYDGLGVTELHDRLAAVRELVPRLAEVVDILAVCTGPDCPGCNLGRILAALRAALDGD